MRSPTAGDRRGRGALGRGRRIAGAGRRLATDRGSGAVLALGVTAALLIVALAAVGLAAGLAARQRIVGAADQAALAAADAARGIVGGSPCDRARELATANRAALSACRVDGWVATVTVAGSFAGIALTATSTAGPAP